MKNLKKILTMVMLLFAATAWGQVKEVTLTVSGDGPTKADATAVALRSAIEQTFGAFVSSNTQILNDELISDEIATISSGNIKKYDEISVVQLPNGRVSVLLKAVVSPQKLTQYVKNHGGTVEFEGATLAMNMRIEQMNVENERIVLANMIKQLRSFAPYLFDYEMTTGSPQQTGWDEVLMPITVTVKKTQNTYNFFTILANTLRSISATTNKSLCYTIKLREDDTQQYDEYFYVRTVDWVRELEQIFKIANNKFIIRDNRGNNILNYIDGDIRIRHQKYMYYSDADHFWSKIKFNRQIGSINFPIISIGNGKEFSISGLEYWATPPADVLRKMKGKEYKQLRLIRRVDKLYTIKFSVKLNSSILSNISNFTISPINNVSPISNKTDPFQTIREYLSENRQYL